MNMRENPKGAKIETSGRVQSEHSSTEPGHMRREGRENKRGAAKGEGWPGPREQKGLKKKDQCSQDGWIIYGRASLGKGSPNPPWRVQGRGWGVGERTRPLYSIYLVLVAV